ncbi:endo-alpha-N-acetylgalactosaminidase family protein [Amycolatopsis aidingensis]|uniref:endo-alpha-N-acetylgalactosaminidase family protein n=1 Tax=Amycolatopsis aidingensis TaxID=2842453 RepID=UPI001C0CBDA5|nr:endo-alpha-N-acetylgalactosaminidase family protein [Amycolatopsis aidingensis]
MSLRLRAARVTGLLAAVLLTAGLLTAVSAPAGARPELLRISSAELEVTLGGSFPYVAGYTDRATGATLAGRTTPLDRITVDGRSYQVTGTGRVGADGAARYSLAVEGEPGARIDASIRVQGRATTFRVDRIVETGSFRVGILDIPGHDLVSVASTQPGAATAFTRLDPDSTRTADRFAEVTADTPVQERPVGATYGIVHTDRLAAAVETNSTYDRPAGETDRDAARLWHQARAEGEGVRVGVWSGQWTHRADTATETEELPWAKVVVTPDANGDGRVNWQDGAIAFRDIAIDPLGAEGTAERVVTHIPFNFASQATHPFPRTLDDVKRISLATDGLGQLAILKGYGAEGHDSAHPDYGGHYNERAGGLAGLNTLLRAGQGWNADFGVHVNATESYPEAHAFDETLVDPDREGWDWLNQSYYIDQRRDQVSGDLMRRFAQLRQETHPNLDFLYIDVFYPFGWLADNLLRDLDAQGWRVGTEWSDKLERSSLWSHWANDLDYGGKTNKGLNSKIIRFIRNHQKDVWNAHPILGNSRIEEFEGWRGEVDWNVFYANIWEHNLPAKFLQQQKILQWTEQEIRFTGGVRGTETDGTRRLYSGDAKVLEGDSYLLPWQDGEKLYHYNATGGRTSWRLPESVRGSLFLSKYRLTETGRKFERILPALDGSVTLDAEPGTPYVLYPGFAPWQQRPDWGEGTPVRDPGFNAGDLRSWRPRGEVRVHRTGRGHQVAEFGSGAGRIEQRLGRLAPGAYSASAWIEVEPGSTRRAELSVRSRDARPVTAFVKSSTAENFVAADEKHGSYFQRVRVLFDVTERDSRPVLRIAAGAGDARVRIDDIRVVRTERASREGTLVFEDFEHVDQGWWPFVKGDAGGATDPRTHLAERNEPYTQRGWNGKLVDNVLDGEWSLKAHEENTGLVYRTVPQSVRFEPGHRYRVEFDYQNGRAGEYSWVLGTDEGSTSTQLRATPLGERHATTRFAQEFTVDGPGAHWVGLRKHPGDADQADLILDNFTVTDLGPANP